MKKVDIYISGGYEYRSKIGTWVYYLSYKGAVIKRCGQVNNGKSIGRVSLFALIKALECIKEPCDITIHSKSPLGFKYPRKSHNKDMLLLVQTSIIKSGHLVTFIDNDDFKTVNTWEEKYGNKTNNKSNKSYAKPSIENKKNPNDVFKHDEQASATHKDWREMYSDLMSDSHGAWVPGSGGY